MGKGVTLSEDEAKALMEALEKYFKCLDEVVEKYRKDDIQGICISCPWDKEHSKCPLLPRRRAL